MLYQEVRNNIMFWENTKYEKILEKKDIKAGLEYLRERAHTIREQKIIDMILKEVYRNDRN